jgi:hypothetical protein
MARPTIELGECNTRFGRLVRRDTGMLTSTAWGVLTPSMELPLDLVPLIWGGAASLLSVLQRDHDSQIALKRSSLSASVRDSGFGR